MSSRRVTSPLEQRPPRRRRRFEPPPGYQNNSDIQLVQKDTDRRMSLSFMDSITPAFQTDSSLQMTPHMSQELSFEGVSSTVSAFDRRIRNIAPMIALEAILSPENIPRERLANTSDGFVDYDDFSDEDINNVMSLPPNPLASIASRITSPGRSAFNTMRDLSFAGTRRRRSAASRIVPPPALLLYQVEASESGHFQQDLPMPPAVSSARYLPLVPAQFSLPNSASSSETPKYTIEPCQKEAIDLRHNIASRADWVPNEMPVELFESITQHLSRDDIKAMRLVNREFERGVSRALFDTVVVPFNTELYDMIEQDKTVKRDFKGKGRIDDHNSAFVNLIPGSLQWKNAMEDKEDKVYKGYGLRVFEGFGSHIRRFGMSFEVKEDALRNPPQKKALLQLESYFGPYDWPSIEYTRFEKLAGLERTADETSQMKLAFSHLDKVRHLALCIDSGLGWMNGPDKSIQSRILKRAPPVFGSCSHGIVDAQCQERAKLWRTLESAYRDSDRLQELKEGRLQRFDLHSALRGLPGLTATSYADARIWASVDTAVIADAMLHHGCIDENDSPPATGVLFVRPDEPERSLDARSIVIETNRPSDAARYSLATGTVDAMQSSQSATSQNGVVRPKSASPTPTKQPFSPAHLDKHQKEWLLEAEWAQRAFLMSYMLAVVDNDGVFRRITSINLARISSHLIPVFYRHDFWEALPNLNDVSLGIIPDWRTVERDEAGFVETAEAEPSKALEAAYRLLKDFIGPRPSIKKLKFGWTAGGEHAEGCIARNSHILPAPITLLARTVQDISRDVAMLHLPHVEHLTLSNCWLSPPAVLDLVKQLEKMSLRKVTFDSVSLTAHPKNPVLNGGNQNAAAMAMGPFGAPFGWQMHAPNQLPTPPAAQHFANQFWQGPGPGQPHGIWAQGMLQQMQQVMIQNGIQQQDLHLMWSTHPAGMTLGQIMHTLTMLAAGGVGAPGLFAGAANIWHAGPANPWIAPAANAWNAAFTAQGLAGLAGAAPVLPPFGAQGAHQAAPPANQQWYEGHREGSWVDIVDALSPGPRIDMYRARDEFEPSIEKRQTELVSIEFRSCGYVQLQNPPYEQSMLEHPAGNRVPSQYFQRRRTMMSASLLSTPDRYLGRIVQYMPEREQDALNFAWDMRAGWEDQDKAREVEYDGYLPGGTGRFSGTVSKNSQLGAAATRST